MPLRVALAALLSLLPLQAACGGDNCYDVETIPLIKVEITDAISGEKICEGVDVSTDVGWPARENRLDCNYTIEIEERDITVEITAEKNFYQPATKSVDTGYEVDQCDQPKHIMVKMQLTQL